MAHVPRGIAGIDIMNESSLRVSDTVVTGVLKSNPDFFSIKIPKNR